MSAFGFYEKDEVVRAIESLAEYEKKEGKNTPAIIESILEVNYGISMVLYDVEEKK